VASRIDILPQLPTKAGHLPTSFRGAVLSVENGLLVMSVAHGAQETVTITRATKVVVRKRRVPQSWLFAGPTVDVSVTPSARDPTALEIDFHPPVKTITGNIGRRNGSQMTVVERSNGTRIVDLTVAGVTDDGHPVGLASLQSGLHVKVDGFTLPGGAEAALSIAITHPKVRMSGTVEAVSAGQVEIVRTSGVRVILRFQAGAGAFATKTKQWFKPAAIPIGAHLSIRGIQEAGWILVSRATVTFRSTLLHGTVLAIGPRRLLRFSTVVGPPVAVHVPADAKVAAGRQRLTFADIEVGDLASVREYPDALGGVLASSIDLHRKLTTHTGFVSSLTSTSFVLILRDNSQLQINIGVFTAVLENGVPVALDQLANGEKVKMEGHLRPDGSVDATKITIEG
jgi:hypothetical protein